MRSRAALSVCLLGNTFARISRMSEHESKGEPRLLAIRSSVRNNNASIVAEAIDSTPKRGAVSVESIGIEKIPDHAVGVEFCHHCHRGIVLFGKRCDNGNLTVINLAHTSQILACNAHRGLSLLATRVFVHRQGTLTTQRRKCLDCISSYLLLHRRCRPRRRGDEVLELFVRAIDNGLTHGGNIGAFCLKKPA